MVLNLRHGRPPTAGGVVIDGAVVDGGVVVDGAVVDMRSDEPKSAAQRPELP